MNDPLTYFLWYALWYWLTGSVFTYLVQRTSDKLRSMKTREQVFIISTWPVWVIVLIAGIYLGFKNHKAKDAKK